MLFLTFFHSRTVRFSEWSFIMKFLLVVFLLVNGEWVRGDTMEGWGSIEYATKSICMEKKDKAEEFQAQLEKNNPRAYKKKFVCEKAVK